MINIISSINILNWPIIFFFSEIGNQREWIPNYNFVILFFDYNGPGAQLIPSSYTFVANKERSTIGYRFRFVQSFVLLDKNIFSVFFVSNVRSRL